MTKYGKKFFSTLCRKSSAKQIRFLSQFDDDDRFVLKDLYDKYPNMVSYTYGIPVVEKLKELGMICETKAGFAYYLAYWAKPLLDNNTNWLNK